MKKGTEIKKIGIAYNLKRSTGEKTDNDEEYDDPETIEAIASEIRSYGYTAVLLHQDDDLAEKLLSEKPDFVLNIAEGIGNTRSRESQVPCLLESMNIPYLGSDPISLGITLDKYLTNTILRSAGVPVPDAWSVSSEADLAALRGIFIDNRMFIVKPRWEGSSKGIFTDSLVSSHSAMSKMARNIFSAYKQPAIVEEFLRKDEITAGVLGNTEPELIGMMRISASVKSDDFFIYSIENKRTWRETVKYEPADAISEKTSALIRDYSKKAFKALELRDISRIDFRLDSENRPKIIDVNPLPGLSPVYSDLPIMFRLAGGKYPDLIRNILKASFIRHGISYSPLANKKNPIPS